MTKHIFVSISTAVLVLSMAAVALLAFGRDAGAGAATRTLSFESPCADPLVTMPGVEPFRPGGASFSLLAPEEGDVSITC